MGSRHWHTGMQFPAATKPTFQSPNFGPVYWPNALPRDEELIKANNCHYEILQAFLVEMPLRYNLGSCLELILLSLHLDP